MVHLFLIRGGVVVIVGVKDDVGVDRGLQGAVLPPKLQLHFADVAEVGGEVRHPLVLLEVLPGQLLGVSETSLAAVVPHVPLQIQPALLDGIQLAVVPKRDLLNEANWAEPPAGDIVVY